MLDIIKYNIDSFNFFMRSSAGHFLVLVCMIIVQLFSTTTFFMMVVLKAKEWIFSTMEVQTSYSWSLVIGGFFAFCLEFGIFFTALNGAKRESNWFAFASVIITFISFHGIFFDERGHFLEFTPSLILVGIGITAFAVFPAVFITVISHWLYDIYNQEGFVLNKPKKNRYSSPPPPPPKSNGKMVEDAEIIEDIEENIKEKLKNLSVN